MDIKSALAGLVIFFSLLSLSVSHLFAGSQGDTEVQFGGGAIFDDDYYILSLSGRYGLFLTDSLLAGGGVGLHFPSENSAVYEPQVYARFFIFPEPPIMPFVGVNYGYLYSPDFTYHTDYSLFVNARIDEDLMDKDFEDELSLHHVTPEAGIYYSVSDDAMLVVAMGYQMYIPVESEIKEGYTLERTEFFSISFGLSVQL